MGTYAYCGGGEFSPLWGRGPRSGEGGKAYSPLGGSTGVAGEGGQFQTLRNCVEYVDFCVYPPPSCDFVTIHPLQRGN